jgi:hypothetical protein
MRQCQVFDAGQYVSGMDWCPMSEEDSASMSPLHMTVCLACIDTCLFPERGFRQYLAVSTMTPAPVDDLSHPTNKPRGCIQIWSLTPKSVEERELAKAQMPPEALEEYQEGYDADMVCEMVICVEGAEVRELKWLPFSCCDQVSSVSHGPIVNALDRINDINLGQPGTRWQRFRSQDWNHICPAMLRRTRILRHSGSRGNQNHKADRADKLSSIYVFQ